MRGTLPVALFFLWQTTLCLCLGPLQNDKINAAPSESFEEIDRNRRIVGGREVKEGDWPFLVFVGARVKGQKTLIHRCGGSLIAPNYVLTAAHCVYKLDVELAVLAGHTRLPAHKDPEWDKAVAVDEYLMHPDYSDYLKENDIALLKLASPLVENGVNISTIPLNADNSCPRPEQKQQCGVAGWGQLQYEGPTSDIAMEVNVTTVDNYVCNLMYGNITPNKLCSGELGVGGKDSCLGDSGGPLVCMCRGQLTVAGIVSYGQGCALPDKPGVYSRVSYNKDWVDSVLNMPYFYDAWWMPN